MALPYSQIVNLPTFSGVDDGYVYLDWEDKVDHIFFMFIRSKMTTNLG